MWPFNSQQRRLDKAIAEATEETQHLLMSFESNRDELVRMMGVDPYVCGYLIVRMYMVASGSALRNKLSESDVDAICFPATRAFFGQHFVEVMAASERYQGDETFSGLFRTGTRDAKMISHYASGQADIRTHPDFQSIFEPLRKESSKIEPSNPLFPHAFEQIRFSRYLRKHFSESNPAPSPEHAMQVPSLRERYLAANPPPKREEFPTQDEYEEALAFHRHRMKPMLR